MRRKGARLALVIAFVLASGCGGGDTGGDAPDATTTTTLRATTTSEGAAATTSTGASTTTTRAITPETPYEHFLVDPEGFIEASSYLIEDLVTARGDHPLSVSPDYVTASDFKEEVEALGVDLTGTEIWVWPVATTGDTLLVLDFDTTATAFEDGDAGEVLGEAIAASPTLANSGITHTVITWHGTDADGPFSMTFSVPFDELRTAVLNDEDIDQDKVTVHIARSGS